MSTADCYAHAARAKFDDGDFAAALELSREGLSRDEHHAGLLRAYGLASYHLGEPLDALEGLEGASLIAPLDPLAQLALADVYTRVDKPRSARAMLRFLAEPGRCPVPLLSDVARLLGKVGADRAALRVCRRLAKARPWYHPAHFGAAHYAAKLGRPRGRVARHLRAAFESAPHIPTYRLALAGVLAEAARPEEACELVRDLPAEAFACPACLGRLQGAAEDAGEIELAMRLRDRRRELSRATQKGGRCDCFGE